MLPSVDFLQLRIINKHFCRRQSHVPHKHSDRPIPWSLRKYTHSVISDYWVKHHNCVSLAYEQTLCLLLLDRFLVLLMHFSICWVLKEVGLTAFLRLHYGLIPLERVAGDRRREEKLACFPILVCLRETSPEWPNPPGIPHNPCVLPTPI